VVSYSVACHVRCKFKCVGKNSWGWRMFLWWFEGKTMFFHDAKSADWIIICPARWIKQVNSPGRWTNWILIFQTRWMKQVNVNKFLNETNVAGKLPAKANKQNNNCYTNKFTPDMTSYWVTYRFCKNKIISMTFW